ncbi:metal ABC transporter substrate-binding protein [Listeria costaricensis]|uniref:metal ABC transporter substrate-binding protein n=1 Tax=Listeria costaricensis TaxID=2026604 RepID=UPI000C077AB1|nr:metal ABC transporter substrate-binding protein [Listeria costaricensis]
MKKWFLMVGAAFALVLALAGCSNASQDSAADKKLSVVTTFYPMYDFTKNVAGDQADISMLIQAGIEPHDYEPSAKDIAKIEQADVFVYNSKDMETWVPSVLKNLDTKKTTVIDASKGIDLLDATEEEDEDDHQDGENKQAHDPHVWLSPVLAQKEVANIAAGLEKADAKNAKTYQENAKTYTQKLAELDQDYQTAFKDAKNRTFVTQHAAFAYLAQQYNLKQVPIAGLSPDQEPSPKRLAELKTYVADQHIPVIYFEEISSPKIAKTLADEAGVKTAVLNPLEGLTAEQEKQGEDYISIMQQNLEALKLSIK